MLKNLHNIPSIELSFKPKFKLRDRPKVSRSNDLYQILMDNWNQNTIGFIEEFKVILLNTSGIVLGLLPVASGGIGGVLVDIRLILVAAINSGASGIVLAHNHPSMNLAPSKADIDITNQIKQGAALLNIKLIDHLIISNDGYLSFADQQMLNTKQPRQMLENFEMTLI